MKFPILHTDHNERPVGAVDECRVLKSGDSVLDQTHPDYDPDARIGDTYFKAHIREDADCDDVWEKVQKGVYKKISIFGVRTHASSECSLHPTQRASPCITKGIRLWSFSLVGDNAINPNSYIKIAKSFSEDLCSEFQEKTSELIKAAFPDSNMAPDSDQTVQGAGTTTAEVTNTEGVVTKSELDPVIQDVVLIKGEMADVKTGIAGIMEYLKKGEAITTPPATETPAASEYITKATLEPVLDLIIKAKVEVAVSEIKKAYDAQFAEMQKKLDAYSNETILKGGHMVMITQDGSKVGEYNPMMANFDALGE